MHYFKSFFFSAIFAVLFISSNQIFAQHAPAIEWQRHFGGKTDQRGLSIAQGGSSLDNFIFAGYTQSNDGDVLGYHGPFITGILHYGDAWIGSVDNAGLIWQRCLGGSEMEAATCVIKTSDGNYVATGWTNSHDYDFLDNHGKDNSDAWVAKFDNNGNIIWKKCFGGSSWDGATCIIETKDEGRDLVIVGSTSSTDGDVSGLHLDTTNHEGDVWIVRISSDGNIRWQKCLGGSGYDVANSVIQTDDGGFAIVGETTSNDGDVSGFHPQDSSLGGGDEWIVKLDSKGNIQWQKCLGGSHGDNANSIVQTSDNGYIVVGQTSSDNGDVSGFHPFTISWGDAWIVKLNSTGSIQWQKSFGGSDYDIAFSILQASDGEYVIAGSTNSNDGDITASTGRGALLVKLNDKGEIKWQKGYGGGAGFAIINTLDGGYATTGYNTDSGYFYPGYVWVIKFSADKASVENDNKIKGVEISQKVFPNPSLTKVHFNLNSDISTNPISFYDIMGRQYFPSYSTEEKTIVCNVKDLVSGIYMLRLNSVSVPFIVQH
jgi:hypothetical protein